MISVTLPEIDYQSNTLNTERLLTILESHPDKNSALTLGLVLKLAKHYAAERNMYKVAQT